MPYAGVGHRFAAVFIDCLVFLGTFVVISLLSGGTDTVTADGSAWVNMDLEGAAFFWWIGVNFAYYVLSEATLGGSFGKLATGLQVVNEDGERILFGQAIVRNLLRIVDGLFFYLVGGIAVWSSPRRQRIGDRAAATVVVRRM